VGSATARSDPYGLPLSAADQQGGTFEVEQEVRNDQTSSATRGGRVAPIVESIEISRRPEDVFSYMTDPSHLSEWQESLVSANPEGGAPLGLGSRVTQKRRIGRRERTMTMEITEASPPRRWAFRGIDGPVRAIGKVTVEPLDDGKRSRVTIEHDFEGRGIGKLLVPLVVRRQTQKELPGNQEKLKERLERRAP
jgi:uncharacterized protein YndB with AHSA1/START domain